MHSIAYTLQEITHDVCKVTSPMCMSCTNWATLRRLGKGESGWT